MDRLEGLPKADRDQPLSVTRENSNLFGFSLVYLYLCSIIANNIHINYNE